MITHLSTIIRVVKMCKHQKGSGWVSFPQGLVPFRTELLRLWPELWVVVKNKEWHHHCRPFGNEHPIDFHILLTDPLKSTSNWEYSESFIQHHVKILHLYQSLVGGRRLGREKEISIN